MVEGTIFLWELVHLKRSLHLLLKMEEEEESGVGKEEEESLEILSPGHSYEWSYQDRKGLCTVR